MLLFGRFVARGGRKRGNRHTDQDCNPPAHVRRGLIMHNAAHDSHLAKNLREIFNPRRACTVRVTVLGSRYYSDG